VGEPAVIREAKAIAHCFRNRALVIHEGELLVGSYAVTPVAAVDVPKESIPPRPRYIPESLPPQFDALFKHGMLGYAGNHTTMDYDTILAVGFRGLMAQINARISRLSAGEEKRQCKRDFLEALKIVAAAVMDLSSRYADHALGLSRDATDARWKQELEAIARTCRKVPAGPPNSFWEACQSVWFAFFFLPDAPGRLDQYLYPFYRRDMASGVLTRDFAKELLSCLWLKYCELCGSDDPVSARHHLTLGGVKPDGSDASNELSYLCLEVTEDLRLLRPQIGLRWHRGTPPKLLRRAVQALRSQTGHPDFCSDEQIVPGLVKAGIRIEDARDFSLSGCHEVIITGKSQMGSVEGFINLPKMLEMTLGLDPHLGNGVDISALDSYEKLWNGLLQTMGDVASQVQDLSELLDELRAGWAGGRIDASLVTKDCIENALGYTQGGARYNCCNWDIIGVTNLADSLAAVRKLVFEDRELGLGELVGVLRSDWNGQEALRRRVLGQFPHFGNDDDRVDEIAADIIRQFAGIMKRRTPFRGGEYTLGTLAGGENMQIVFGRQTGATPDGRKSGEPLADSLAAAQGRDRRGVTAMLNSVAKMPHTLLPTSTSVNVRLDPKLLEAEDGVEKIAALIHGHFASGGQQLQFNFVNREMLLEAKRCPEKHPSLMVRVAGYSAPFVSLWDDLQNEIISRTEHRL
jgi:formate C-acetyltransferase